MRRRTSLALALSLATVAAGAPAALAHGGGGGDRSGADDGTRTYKLWARVTADATPTGVNLRVLGADRDMRRALGGAKTLTAAIGTDTRIWLVGRARKDRAADGRGHRSPKGHRRSRDRDWNDRFQPAVAGATADLTRGDLVKVRFRAPAGTAAADLPAATRIVDFGTVRACRGKASIRMEMKHGRSRGGTACFPRRGFALR